MSSPDVLEISSPAEDAPAQEVVPDERVTVLQSETAKPADQEKAFAEIVTAYQGKLTGYAGTWIGPNDAEDIVQVAFLNAYRAIDRFKNNGEVALSTWLHTIVGNLIKNYARDNKKASQNQSMDEVAELIQPISSASRIGVPGDRLEFQETLAVLGDIHKGPRTAMIKQYEGHSYEHIADMQDTTVPAIKSHLVRARRRAVELIEETETQ